MAGKRTRKNAYQTITSNLAGLTRPELIDLQALIARMLEAMDAEDEQPDGPISSNGQERGHGTGGRAWYELKIVNNCGPYVYLRWRDGDITRSHYIGKAADRT